MFRLQFIHFFLLLFFLLFLISASYRIYRHKYLGVMIAGTWLAAFCTLIPTWRGKWGEFGLDHQAGSCSILPDKDRKCDIRYIAPNRQLTTDQNNQVHLFSYFFFFIRFVDFFFRLFAKRISIHNGICSAMHIDCRMLCSNLLHCTKDSVTFT